jgi:recombination protein RecA
MSLEELISKLDKNTQARVKAASSINIEKIPTASLGLNIALGGGFGKGRQSTIYGNKSASKSSTMLQTIAENQKLGKVCAWIDAEGSYDPNWAINLGVDNDNLLVAETKSIDDMTAVVCSLMKAKVDLVVVDSISSLLPSTYFEKEGKDDLKEGLEGTKQIGTVSKELSVAVNKFNYANTDTALVLISQVRNQFSTWGASLKPMGGQAVMFFSSTVVKLWSSASEREQITGELIRGDKIIRSSIGRPVTYTVEYNKIGPPNQTGQYDFYYAGDSVGIDQIGELADIAEQNDVIHKGGAWYSYGENKFQGRTKLVEWLKENPTVREEIEIKCQI